MQYESIDNIKPASYNPRKISNEKFEQLKESIRTNGFCIPVLVNRANHTIIAGHQRTWAAREIGIKDVPCFYIDNITESDEILLNQIHNGSDNEREAACEICADIPLGFTVQDAAAFIVRGFNAQIVKEICHLLLKYGNVLMAVMAGGQIVIGKNYIYACQLLKMSVNVSRIKADGELLKDKYGDYCYEHLEKTTWVQCLAQMNRLSEKGKKDNKSSLYETFVLPHIKDNNDMILDFGCGKGAYISRLKERGLGVEFYNWDGNNIDIAKGNRQINSLAAYLNKCRLFDAVVCDSVLNSVDSVKAECSVMNCLNAFLKIGGALFISGRRLLDVEHKASLKHTKTAEKRYMYFLDADNFTAIFRHGKWFYQHFHSKEQAVALVEKYGFKVERYFERHSTSWQIKAKKIKDVPLEDMLDAIDFEFNLPLPNGKSYGRNEEIKGLVRRIYNGDAA